MKEAAGAAYEEKPVIMLLVKLTAAEIYKPRLKLNLNFLCGYHNILVVSRPLKARIL